MAALCTGISYGLSQSLLANENKELIFVKLTDSAFRAIEEFQKNQNKISSHATIQFLGNEGYLSFPSLSTNSGQKFSFSITETEGLQGSFDCIQQNHNQLEVLGSLPNKMRIHANEDVYEITRHRMAVAEENVKNKCTLEIKPNQTDIGRKVKVKTSINRLTNIPNSNILNKRDSSSVNSSSNSLNNNININHNSLTTISLKNNINNTTNPQQNQHQPLSGLSTQVTPILSTIPSKNTSINISSSNTTRSTLSSSVPSKSGNNRNQNNGNRTNPEIMKRPLKERLIHLLALRPYKKPEIMARVVSDGIKDKEKPLILNILKFISFMRDNTYHINRHIWNDVNEDWPFYTEQDRQILKRRKPQNLTPPLSSDGGSSTSGQSPTSTHNGSPPPVVKRPSINGDKYSDTGPNSKKPRISHFKKDIVNQDNTRFELITANDNQNSLNRRKSQVDSRDSANLNPRSREQHSDMLNCSNNYYGVNANAQDDSSLSLSFKVLDSEAAKRISPTTENIIIQEQNHEKESFEEQTKHLREKSCSTTNGSYDFSGYTNITSIEQRRSYKGIFDMDYNEYRQLHTYTEQISRRFAKLEEDLRNVSNNDQQYKEIQKQILTEFQNTQEQKKRFNYLHHKLSHIKKLVFDYDSSITNGKILLQENY